MSDEQQQDYGEEVPQQEQASDMFVNNHDLIGVEGIIRAQKTEIEKKKVGNISFLKYFNSNRLFIVGAKNRK